MSPSTSRALAAVAAAFVVAWPFALGAQRSLEYEVKAAFLFNFVQFVEWPGESLRAGEPFRICLVGENPFAGVLERTIAGDEAAGRPIEIETIAPEAPPARCQVLFVPRTLAVRVPAILRLVGTLPILTVGESARFLDSGGLVNFVVEGGHVRFDINADVAAARGLRISSKLLRVARSTGGSDRRER